MTNPGLTSQNLEECIKLATTGFQVAMELGSGDGKILNLCSCEDKVGVEIYLQYIKDAERKYPDLSFIRADIRDFVPRLEPGAVDVFLICDVLEHFERVEALDILEKCKEIAKRIVLFIPIGKHPQGTGPEGNVFQTHRDTWEYEELEALGFSVARWDTFHDIPGKDRRAAFCIWDKK